MNNKQGKTLGKRNPRCVRSNSNSPPKHHYGEKKEWVLTTRPCQVPKYKRYTEIKQRENLMGKTTPQGTMYVKRRTTVVRQPCPSLQDDFAENETFSQ